MAGKMLSSPFPIVGVAFSISMTKMTVESKITTISKDVITITWPELFHLELSLLKLSLPPIIEASKHKSYM